MTLCELPDYKSSCTDISRACFATNIHANLLTVAANAADLKADAFSKAGDERKAHLHREIGRTRRRVIDVLQARTAQVAHAS